MSLSVDALCEGQRGRICLMGINGSGKTRYLERLHQELKNEGIGTAFIRAQRPIATQSAIAGSPQITNYDTAALLQELSQPQNHNGFRVETLAIETIQQLYSQDQNNYHAFVQQVAAWIERGHVDEMPQPPERQADRLLKLLGGSFGYALTMATAEASRYANNINLTANIGGNEVNIRDISDGERQIFALSILLLQKSDQRLILLVDEPELHLNEARAIELWEGIEAQLPNVTFLYATHSLAFATRPTIDELYLVEKEAEPRLIEAQIEADVIKDLVGARIQLQHRTLNPIFCEDTAQARLINDLFDSSPFEAVVVGNWHKVIAPVEADEAFKSIVAASLTSTGVIDRDHRGVPEILALEKKGVFVLPYNEAESIILHPSVAARYFNSIEKQISDDEYLNILVKAAKQAFPETIEKLARQLEQEFRPILKYEIENNSPHRMRILPKDDLIKEFKRRSSMISQAIIARDAEEVLRLVKGKKLYQMVRKILRESNAVDLPEKGEQHYLHLRISSEFRAIVAAIPAIAEFKAKIIERAGLSSISTSNAM